MNMDNSIFCQIAEQYIDVIYRLAYSTTRCREDAEDITQDVLIKLYRCNLHFESDDHLRNWIIRVTLNQCKTLFRVAWRKAEPLEDYAESLGFESKDYLDLFTAVMNLDKKYRVVVVLYYIEGYSTSEIATLLNIPINTVSTRLARARTKLKDYLSGE